MSAGTKIVQLRDALVALLPHATGHSLRCHRHPCTCNLERAVQVARQLTKVDPARTCAPGTKPRARARGAGLGAVVLLVALATGAGAQSLPERAKARGDSILAVAKCWRFAKTPDVAVTTSSCPDSLEATTTMLPHAPVMHLGAGGEVHFHLQVGQTVQLQATLLRGFLFVWPAGVTFRGASVQTIPVAPPDAVRRVL